MIIRCIPKVVILRIHALAHPIFFNGNFLREKMQAHQIPFLLIELANFYEKCFDSFLTYGASNLIWGNKLRDIKETDLELEFRSLISSGR